MAVVLVGNSDSLLTGQPRGRLIDSFGTVIRFNGGRPDEHKEALGQKTDYWSFSTRHEVDYLRWKIPGAIPMLLNRRIEYPVKVPNAVYNDEVTYNALIRDYGHPRPSTGLITAHYITKRWDCDLHCIGFDFFKRGTWYRGSNANIPHDGEREREFMVSLGVTIL